MSAAARPKSFDQLYRDIREAPEGSRGEILEPGRVHWTMGRPGKPHRRAAQGLYRDLAGIDQSTTGAGWWIEVEPEVRFGERLFDPDLAGWRVERVSELPDDNPIEILPDWCCEVISRGTGRTDLTLKLPLYIREDVAHVWIVDPTEKLVQVFVPVNGKPTLIASASDEETARLPPFELDLHPARWWLGDGAPSDA